ncbi:MAG: lipoate--protein ligase family protein [Candidatus Kapabacteria bacterium]|nr:lipoate--protein ligase family protein [Candidatus Kapabacteria bacterium]
MIEPQLVNNTPHTIETSAQDALLRLAESYEARIRIEQYCSGTQNMEHDIALAADAANAHGLILIRLYSWKPWCISLGMNQKETDIDIVKCRNEGIDVVRRPTGGRAVFHARELTYSFAMQLQGGISHHDVYAGFHAILLNAVRSLGAQGAGFEQSQPNFAELYSNNHDTLSCFASSARYELTSGGKKLVGSAQRKYGTVLLQHGSLLLDSGFERLAEFNAGLNDDQRESFAETVRTKAVTLSQITGRKIGFQECAAAIMNELQRVVAIRT